MPFPKVKSHELASRFPARLTSAARPALTSSQRYSNTRRNWQHRCQRAYDAKVPNDNLEALRTMPQTAVIIWILIIFALIVPALAGVRLLPSPW